MANEAEKDRWNDEVFARIWTKSEMVTDQVTPILLDALALESGEKVLDIGCGGGNTSIAAAHAVGTGGTVIGVDVSKPLVALARRRATVAGVTNVRFVLADAQTDRIGEGRYDVATSQFGVMFFDDATAAFANIASQLQPRGRLVFACWQPMDRNPWFPGPALAPYVPPTPSPAEGTSPTGPFVLGDPLLVTRMLTAVGLADIDVAPIEIVAETPADPEIDEERQRLLSMGVVPENLDDARAALERHRAQFRNPQGVSYFRLAVNLVRARHPYVAS